MASALNKQFVGRMPGMVKTSDDTKSDIFTLLGLTKTPVAKPTYNDNGEMPPLATFEIDGVEYDAAPILQALETNHTRNHVFYVDGARTDTYTANGSFNRPYKTAKAAADAINLISATLLSSAANFELCKFIINIAPGKYTDNFSLLSARYIRINMEGAEISGNITIAQEQHGLTDYYSKVEFVGGHSNRANRGNCGLISGNITFTKTAYDSLAYAAFSGIHVSGNISYGTAAAPTHGTWVLCLQNFYMSGSDKFISAYPVDASECLLIESYGYNYIKAHLAKQDGSAAKISLYDCNNTYFDLINITPTENLRVKECTFNSTTEIVASKTLSIDANSYQSLKAQSPTLTGITISPLDGFAADNGITVRYAKASLPIFADTNAHDTGIVIPSGSIIKNVWLRVATQEATGTTKTVDIGVSGGVEDGFLAGVSVAAAGTVSGTLLENVFTIGELLCKAIDISSSLYVPEPYVCPAATTICYTLKSNNFAELVASVIVEYVTIS